MKEFWSIDKALDFAKNGGLTSDSIKVATRRLPVEYRPRFREILKGIGA